MPDEKNASSTRPYLIRALYEWCTDNGLTPYVAVKVDDSVQVPREYVKDGEIVLNISYDATSSLKLDNAFIAFSARFAGTARDIMVPMDRVIAIYARENGQGMAFPLAPGAAKGAPRGKALRTPQPTTVLDKRSPAAALPAPAPVRVGEVEVKLVTSGPVRPAGSDNPPAPPGPPAAGRPTLTRVK
ncbi:MAG: ClpXP protease specificity-enhancing factor [Burkholderiaceae bacterium]